MLLTGKLVKTIEKNSDTIAERWVDEVAKSPYTRSYWNVPREELHERAASICRRMGYFLDRKLPKEKMASFYKKIGENRRSHGYEVEEVVMALMLLKREIWLFILQEGLLTKNIEVSQALLLNNRVILYFDRAIYYVAMSYQDFEDKEEAEQAASC
jgi:hypothetical protein